MRETKSKKTRGEQKEEIAPAKGVRTGGGPLKSGVQKRVGSGWGEKKKKERGQTVVQWKEIFGQVVEGTNVKRWKEGA